MADCADSRFPPGGRARALAAALAAAALAACTTIRVSDGASVRTTYYPGIALVRVAPGDAMQVAEVRSLGAAVVGNQMSLGWLESRIALVPQGRCQLLLWRAGDGTVAELRSLLGPETELCTREGEGR